MKNFSVSVVLAALALGCVVAHADGQKLRILSWADYVPADLIAAFKKETGIDVEVTLSNNEEMISKLRATGGAGYDLAQPSQDRIASTQREFGIYKPIDLSKVKIEEFQPALLDIVKRNASLDGKLYGLPYLWGTDGLVVNTRAANTLGVKVTDYNDVCNASLRGKTAIRLRRPVLMAFAFEAPCMATRKPMARSWTKSAPLSLPASPISNFSTTIRTSCSTASAPAKW